MRAVHPLLAVVWLTTSFWAGAPVQSLAQEGVQVTASQLEEVTRELMDPCENCRGKLLSACDCPPAVALQEDVRSRLARGEKKEAIVEALVLEHGEWIRSAPPKRGFNLVGWGLPFVLIALGGGAVLLFLRRAVRATRAPAHAPEAALSILPPVETGGGDPEAQWRRRLQTELEHLDR